MRWSFTLYSFILFCFCSVFHHHDIDTYTPFSFFVLLLNFFSVEVFMFLSPIGVLSHMFGLEKMAGLF